MSEPVKCAICDSMVGAGGFCGNGHDQPPEKPETREQKDARRAEMFEGWNEPLSETALAALRLVYAASILPVSGLVHRGIVLDLEKFAPAKVPGINELLKKGYITRSPVMIAVFPGGDAPALYDAGMTALILSTRGREFVAKEGWDPAEGGSARAVIAEILGTTVEELDKRDHPFDHS